MDFLSSPEFWDKVLNVVQVLALALIAGWVKIQMSRTQELKGMQEQTINEARETKEVVETIRDQTNGTTKQILDMYERTSEGAGELKRILRKAADQHGVISKDKLDEIEEKYFTPDK